MSKFLFFLNSFYLGMGVFFSIYVAPTLFKVLEKAEAGKVVEKVFPVYFGISFLVMLFSLVVGWKVSKIFFTVSSVNFLLHGVHLFYVLPKAKSLKVIDYSEFMKWHGVSMGLNLLGLLLVLVMIILLTRKM
ncbi:DUF4149 domain-containing protein [Thermocrinis sp.]